MDLPNSPDMNPIENVFELASSNLQAKSTTYEQLISVCKEEWNSISLEMIRNCINRLPKVMQWVSEHDGEFYCK